MAIQHAHACTKGPELAPPGWCQFLEHEWLLCDLGGSNLSIYIKRLIISSCKQSVAANWWASITAMFTDDGALFGSTDGSHANEPDGLACIGTTTWHLDMISLPGEIPSRTRDPKI
jgi:hypothetical protein